MRFLVVLILYLITTVSVHAQTAKPIKWTISISKTEVKQGDVLEIIMKAEIKPDWYLYSSDFDPNLGPTVTSILFDADDSYSVVNQLKPFGAKEKYDSLWEGKVRYFTSTAELKQELKILRKNPVIKARLYYQVCNDKVGKCIPYEEVVFFDNLKVEVTEPNQNTTINTEQGKENPPKVVKKVDTVKESTIQTNAIPLTLAELEAEKEKLKVQDNNGKDYALEQLKEFVQKYGGGK